MAIFKPFRRVPSAGVVFTTLPYLGGGGLGQSIYYYYFLHFTFYHLSFWVVVGGDGEDGVFYFVTQPSHPE